MGLLVPLAAAVGGLGLLLLSGKKASAATTPGALGTTPGPATYPGTPATPSTPGGGGGSSLISPSGGGSVPSSGDGTTPYVDPSGTGVFTNPGDSSLGTPGTGLPAATLTPGSDGSGLPAASLTSGVYDDSDSASGPMLVGAPGMYSSYGGYGDYGGYNFPTSANLGPHYDYTAGAPLRHGEQAVWDYHAHAWRSSRGLHY